LARSVQRRHRDRRKIKDIGRKSDGRRIVKTAIHWCPKPVYVAQAERPARRETTKQRVV